MEPSAAISETVQLGSYRLLRQIGAGGMGCVWLAEHNELGRRAAIKVLHPDCSSRPDVVRRFFNEARAATAIADPGIVQIFDFGRHTDGSAYIVMELLDGEALDSRLARRGPLPIGDAIRIMRQVANALAAAHARGIIHRDLKPENIYLARDAEVVSGERAKILDFGIAKVLHEKSSERTHTSAIFGTPIYMSPEQCRGAGEIDPRSDIYSLGCVLFTLLAGRPPFISEGAGELIAMHICEPAPRASTLRPEIPADLDTLIARCLAKQADARFATAEALAAALAAIEQRLDPSRSLTPLPPPPPAPTEDEAPLDAPERHGAPMGTTLSSSAGSATPLPAPRRRRMVALIGAALAIAAFATWGVARTSTAAEPPHTPIASHAAAPLSAPDVVVAAARAPAPLQTAAVQPSVTRAAESVPQITISVAAMPQQRATTAASRRHATKKPSRNTSSVSTAAAPPAFDDDGMPTHR